ncbi:hypothetical protein N4G70_20055 [Streptomyces sp. ASQP_92]|uniref:hypothetical protein n=1 Tax=unclassified Streptomyces TaxID=2593676 RepID=UPI0021BDFC61|nr:hypothetical protein [Streptomyces sp. ASQP_92]MCT9091137.1 hypothetical protein [Streptomyces sp. ASQP_92]
MSHQTSLTERGSFAVARCSCGWAGPARRSRDRARLDAETHALALPPPPAPPDPVDA